MSSGVHDLGGREGVGAINPTPAEPVWKAEWEKHAHTLFPLAFRAGFFGIDQFVERAIAAAARVDAAAIIPSPCESAALIRVIKSQQRKVRFPGRCGSVDTGELQIEKVEYLADDGATGWHTVKVSVV